ncbi:MAG: hypothetical protein ACE5K2_04555, partial [Candidatus Zixiibacteriota bacterium]
SSSQLIEIIRFFASLRMTNSCFSGFFDRFGCYHPADQRRMITSASEQTSSKNSLLIPHQWR